MLYGNSKPRIAKLPVDVVSSAGAEAVELAGVAGLVFDPWQEYVLDAALSERADGKWAATEVGIVVPRQNGKGSILEGRELAGLYLFNEELILHSAHEFKTSREGFLRIQFLVQQSDYFTKRIKKIYTAHGAEGIELKAKETIITGSGSNFIRRGKPQRLSFVARSGGSGRGFTGDVVILDEAYRLPDRVMTALLPTMSAKENAQVWYTSSAANQEEHDQCEHLARVRDRGMRNVTPRLAYFEWSVDQRKFIDKVKIAKGEGKTWRDVAGGDKILAVTNPGLGYRVQHEAIVTELNAFKMKAFMVERLGIGDWPDVNESGETGPIPRNVWQPLRNDDYNHGENLVFAVDISIDRKHGSIAVYSEDESGIGHLELIKQFEGAYMTAGIINYLVEKKAKWKPLAIGIDGKSPTSSLVLEMEKAGLKRPRIDKRPKRGDLIVLTLQEMADACGQILDACTDAQINYFWNADLDSAVSGAELRKVGDVQVWGRREATVDISPLTAGTIARWVYLTHGEALKQSGKPLFAFV